MKKLLFIIGLGLLAAWPVQAQNSPEQIQDFQVKIEIQPDASVRVQETIRYDFGQTEHHGIFRNIPYKYSRNGINYNLKLSQVAVADDLGQPYKFKLSKQQGEYQIKIGDPDTYVTGIQNYKISYTARGAINYFDDHDELYWNAIGSGWDVQINNAVATVVLPPSGTTQTAKATCFEGVVQTQNPCNQISSAEDQYIFHAGGLNSHEAFTAVVGFPKGLVHQPSNWEILWHTLRDNLIFFLPIVVLFAMWGFWRAFGRDPKSALPIVAQYEAPDRLTPIEIGYLVDERSQNSDLSAEVIYLATLGYLKIERIPKKGFFGHEDFKLKKLKPVTELTNDFDQHLHSILFGDDANEILLSQLKSKGKIQHHSFKLSMIPAKLTKAGYFLKNPNTVRMEYMIGAAVLIGILVLLTLRYAQWSITLSFVLSGIVAIIFGYFMPRKTQKGADTQQQIKGLKLYLSVAEKDRLDFHNDPGKDPQIFEKLLPYAIALGVSDQWAKKFEGAFEYRPTWYSDPSMTAFNFVVFNHALGNFNSGFNSAVAASQIQSAGSGGSGFSGGFSGGGFGGGGGGSW